MLRFVALNVVRPKSNRWEPIEKSIRLLVLPVANKTRFLLSLGAIGRFFAKSVFENRRLNRVGPSFGQLPE